MKDKDQTEAMESLQHYARRKREGGSRGGLMVAVFIIILVAVALYLFAM
ncbi:MAG: hypothetical protein ABFC91_05745 [Methanobacteriaceae archaeon]